MTYNVFGGTLNPAQSVNLGVIIFHLSEKNKHLYILSHNPWTHATTTVPQSFLDDTRAVLEPTDGVVAHRL